MSDGWPRFGPCASKRNAREQKAAEALTRIRSEYKAGELTAAEWREFRDELTAERTAAAAEAVRLRRHEDSATGSSELHDAEADTLRQLADLRAPIATEISRVARCPSGPRRPG